MRERHRGSKGRDATRRAPRAWGWGDAPLAASILLLAGAAACDGTDAMVGLDPPTDTVPAQTPPPPDTTLGLWEPAAPMPGPRMGHAAILYVGDLVVAGGIVGPGEHTASVIRLRRDADTWEELAPMPYLLTGLNLVVVRDTLYALGGDGPFFSRPEQALFRYDPGRDAWDQLADIPDARVQTEAVAMGERIWLTGGPVNHTTEHGGPLPADTVLEYDPSTDRWSRSIRLHTPRLDHELVRDEAGLLYFVGGQHGEFPRVFPDVDVYDPGTGGWLTVGDPFATWHSAAAYAAPYVHVVGGDEHRDVHRALDTRTYTWVALPRIPFPLEWPQLVSWDGALWLIGGFRTTETDGREIEARVWRLDLDDLGRSR